MSIQRNRWFSLLLLGAGLAGACGGGQQSSPPTEAGAAAATPAATAAAGPSVPLIPRALLFGNPERTAAQISPDAKHVSWLAPKDGVLNVWVAPAGDLSAAKPVTSDTNRGVRIYFWAYTSQHILYLQDQGGDENWRVYAVELADGSVKDLTPFDETQAQVQQVSPKFPNEIIVGLNNRDAKFHDLHKVDIGTGKLDLVQKNDEYAGFVTDDDYKVRLAMLMTPDGGREIFEPGKQKDSWESFLKVPMEDTLGTHPVGFDKTGKVLYMTDSRGRDTAALVALDLARNATTVVAEDPQVDVGDVVLHPTEKTIQAAVFTWSRDRWQVIDPAIEADLKVLDEVADGEVSIASRSLDDSTWIVSYVLDDGPLKYYRYDRASHTATYLFSNRPALEKVGLSRMHPVVIPSADGLQLVSYLTLPPGSDQNGDGRPEAPVPMVMNVHGGPWGRDRWGLNGTHQWLANRGYAVLSVNFRGSTGFGKKFVNAGNLEWAAKMHGDLIDAKKWAVQNAVASAEKVCIMGASYGGYATLVGLTFTPTEFACGVDIVGPSNLVTLLESIPPYWAPMLELFAKRVGDPRTDDGKKLLAARSPLSRADTIVRPLLIAQGANDPRVKQAESDQIVTAMQQKKIPVTYALFPDEGHGFARPENRLAFYALVEQLFARHLGGRAEPIGEDLEGSSLIVSEGADEIPGLSEALESHAPVSRSGGAAR